MARVRLDHRGIGALLKSADVAREISSRASDVAAAVRSAPEISRNGMTVGTASGTTDRARTIVTITHAGGLGVQAKHGTLSRAVSAAGLGAMKETRNG